MNDMPKIPRYGPKATYSDRASGYRSTSHALAELVDNSFDWGASSIKVIFIEQAFDNAPTQIKEILVCDDGKGMSHEVLRFCLTVAEGQNMDESGRLRTGNTGKFGMGLPKSSVSQCRLTNVYTWQNGGESWRHTLDLDEINDIFFPEPEKEDLPDYYHDLGAKISSESGTIISWRNCDLLSAAKAETLIKRSENLFGKIYRYFLKQNKTCELLHFKRQPDGQYKPLTAPRNIRPNDPLFLMEDTVVEDKLREGVNGADTEVVEHYEKFLKEGGGHHPTSEKIESFPLSFQWRDKTYKFDITLSKAKLDISKPGVKAGGQKPVGRFYVTKGIENVQQTENISFVRANRELDSGRFRVKLTAPGDERHRWWGIEVKFDSDADDLMGVTNTKQGVGFEYTPKRISDSEWDGIKWEASQLDAREALFSMLSKLLEDKAKILHDKVKEDYKIFETKQADNINPLGGEHEDTGEAGEKVEGERTRTWSEEEKKNLYERLRELYPKVDEELVAAQVDYCIQKNRKSILLYTLESGTHLWDLTTVDDYLLITVNMNHRFYDKVMGPLREDDEKFRQAIELLIKAFSKAEHDSKLEEKERARRFRGMVSLHLDEYLDALSDL